MNSPISHLTEVLQTVKDSALSFEGQLKNSEAATRAALIDPILRALGWDIADPSRVMVEKTQSIQRKFLRVDYALMHKQDIKIVVEAKKLGGNLKEDFLQLVNYSFGFNIGSLLVTDGLIWHHYQHLSSDNQHPSREFNLALDDLPQVAAYLVQQMDAALISPETPKIDELSQRVEALEKLASSLEKQVASARKGHAPDKPTTNPKPASVAPVKLGVNPSPPGIKQNWYSINGGDKVFNAKAIEVTVEALRQLAGISEDVLPQIEAAMVNSFAAKKKKVIRRRWIARSREQLYDNPKLLASSVEIVSGWWLGTNYSNGDKRDMLAIAASTARQFNIQLDFNLE